MPATPWPQSLLSGGSDNGRRILARDWSATPMGPLESWPPALRTALLTCLESRFPLFVYWGPQLVQFYNDAGKAVMGAKDRVNALGSPIQEVFPEIWPQIGPMFASVREGKATWAEDQRLWMERSGFVEETYLTWSYSPLRDDAGAVGGIFCSVIEVTRQVVGERRLKILREIAARASGVATVERAVQACFAVMEGNHPDLPFAVLRLRTPGTQSARIAASFGVTVGGRSEDRPLPESHPVFTEIARTRQGVRVPQLPFDAKTNPHSPSGEPAKDCFVLPIVFTGDAEIGAFLTVGLSPNRPFDEEYRSFLNLLAGQISAALSGAHAQEQAQRRADALAELDRAKTAFFSNVSHEFRTPLTLLLGPLEEALSSVQGERAELSRQSLQSAYRNAIRLLKLVNALLDFSRVEAGRLEAEFEQVDLSAYTRDLASQFASVMERGGLRLGLDLPPLPSKVSVDRQMWEKIVFNLLSNAFKFTLEGSVSVSLRADGAFVELRVADTGSGIAPEQLPRVFERFHRVPGTRSRSFEGSGIGLALLHELVKLHGGTARVESAVDQGTTFIVRIPVAHGGTHDAGSLEPSEPAQRRTDAFVGEAAQWLAQQQPEGVAAISGSQRSVLVVDDNADMRRLLWRLLSPTYAVETAVHGKAALEAVQRKLPDLILSDIMMPELDGFGLIRQLRADPRTRLVPVILLSARAGEEATVEGLEAGADDYLVKPFSPRELLARVQTQISMAGLRRDLEAEKTARKAREEIRKLTLLLDASPDHVFLLDRQGRYVYRNKSAADALEAQLASVGRAGESTLNRSGREMGFDPSFLGRFEAEQAKAFAGQAVVSEVVFPSPSGPRAFEYILTPLPDDGGVVDLLLGITRDIHDLKAAIRVRDDFLSIASHELKTPLTSLSLQTQLRKKALARGAPFPPERMAKMFSDDERQINRLVRLVDDMLDISRLRSGKFQIHREPLDLQRVVGEAVERMRADYQSLSVPLTYLSAGPVEGSWDRYRVEQIVTNLLTNGLKYGDGKPVELSLSAVGGTANLTVRDRGIGIAEADHQRIFQQFERAVADKAISGLGLGLYIVQQIVEAHGGAIRVQSALGQGSTFVVELPLEPAPGTTDASPDPRP